MQHTGSDQELQATERHAPKSPKGFVSSRIQMFESPRASGLPPKPYRHRPQDSFHVHQHQQSQAAIVDEPREPEQDTMPSRSISQSASRSASVSFSRSISRSISQAHESVPQQKSTIDSQGDVVYASKKANSRDDSLAQQQMMQQGQQMEAPQSPPSTMTTLRNYVGYAMVEKGVEHYNKGEFKAALQTFTTALRTQKASVGEDHLCIALTLGNVGATHLRLGNLDAAERVLQKSLLIKKRLQPGMLLADTLNNLGNCANVKGEYDLSMCYYEDALVDLEEKEGPLTDIGSTLFNIGRLFVQKRKWTDALIHLEEACGLTREAYGPNHPAVAEVLDLIGFSYLSLANYDMAMVSFTGALAIHRRLHGPIHEEVAKSLLNVGMVRECRGDLAEAWEGYTIANDLFTRLEVRPDYPAFVAVKESIDKVERIIAKKNQHKLVEKHRATAQVKGNGPFASEQL